MLLGNGAVIHGLPGRGGRGRMRRAIRRYTVVGLAALAVLAGVAVVYRATNDGVLRTVTLRGPRTALPSAMAIDTRTSRAFIASADNIGTYARVAMLDTASGALLRTITAGSSASGMLVDERTERVLVASMGTMDGFTPLGPGSGRDPRGPYAPRVD